MTGTAEQLMLWLMHNGEDGKAYDLTEHREKRSLSQNAYYHVLLARLADKLRISVNRLHNELLRDCAHPFIIGGKVAMQTIPDTEAAEQAVLEAETYHLKPTAGIITGNDGQVYRWYVVLRGSSTFDVSEMTGLLDRLIAECKQQGIETMTDAELERIRAYERNKEQEKTQENAGLRDIQGSAGDRRKA